jgi:spoIIIJ-associated protein
MTAHHDSVDVTDQPGTAAEGSEQLDHTSTIDTDTTDTDLTDTDSTDTNTTDSDSATEAGVTGEVAQDATTDSPGTTGTRPARRATAVADLEREGEVAADFLETLLDIADLDGDIDVDVDGDRAAVSIVDSEEGRVPRRLVGQDGAVLDALQELTRLAVQSATGERSRLMLDVAGHRADRRASLVAIAREAIARVKDSGERAALDPMTAFERKVVHDEVLAAGLSSESEGTEPRRYVVVLPA